MKRVCFLQLVVATLCFGAAVHAAFLEEGPRRWGAPAFAFCGLANLLCASEKIGFRRRHGRWDW